MPEVILCRHCNQIINKETDQYVVTEKVTDRHPEALVHMTCAQKRTTPFAFDEWLRKLRWPSRL